MTAFPVIISYSNYGYLAFAKNMLLNLNKLLKFHKVYFYCLDEKIYHALKNLSLENLDITFSLVRDANLSSQLENYGSANYNKITHTKIYILRDALKKFNFIHFIDCDVVCIHEPNENHYAKYSPYDIIFQHDAGFYSATKFHAPTLNHIWACTGNTSLRNTKGTHYILDKIEEYQKLYPNKNDQECLYQYFQDKNISNLSDFKHAKLYTYPVQKYTNGYWFDHNIGDLKSTYFFHANHVVGLQNKINLLKKAYQWYL